MTDDLHRAAAWPVLDPAALHGLPGEIARTVSRHSEADIAAVLATALSVFGAMAGDRGHVSASNSPHPARLWPLIAGSTSAGAKGTSWSTTTAIFKEADPEFFEHQLLSGMSSAEGLIEEVRDPSGEPGSENFDEGVLDKRRIIHEPEYASVLLRGRREGNNLLQVLREAWDGDTLRTMTRRTNRLTATDPHIVLVAHVTPGELRSRLKDGDLAGGSINRLLPILSRRSQRLPDGGNVPQSEIDRLSEAVKQSLRVARHAGSMTRTPEARDKWADAYMRLTAEKPEGRFEQATSRAAPMVLRLSVAYALADSSSSVINADHLAAALALWDYAERSAAWLFSGPDESISGPTSDGLLEFIASAGDEGVTRTEVSVGYFRRNRSAAEIDAAIRVLEDAERIVAVKDPVSTGRPTTRYYSRKETKPRNSAVTSIDAA